MVAAAFALSGCAEQPVSQSARKIVLLAGAKSHGPGLHEYIKSVRLLKVMLDQAPGLAPLHTEIHYNGWPEDPTTLNDADLIVTNFAMEHNAIYLNNGLDLKEIYPADNPDQKIDAKSRNLRFDLWMKTEKPGLGWHQFLLDLGIPGRMGKIACANQGDTLLCRPIGKMFEIRLPAGRP